MCLFQMKAYDNLFSKFATTGAVTDLCISERRRISDGQVSQVLWENLNMANTNLVAISNMNSIAKQLQMSYTKKISQNSKNINSNCLNEMMTIILSGITNIGSDGNRTRIVIKYFRDR